MPRHVLLVFLAALCLAGCGGVAGSDAGRQVIRIGNGAEPQDLDPHTITGVTEHRLLTALFEGLVNLNPKTLEPVPGVAETWEVSPDGKVYTFHLRHDARWSNGDPITAVDFLYAWRRILAPALGSEYAYMLHLMVNAKEYNEGTITDFALVGAKAPDPYTVVVTLSNPAPYFLSMQIHYTWFPVHQATIEKWGAMDQRGTKWTRPGNMVSNGPFMLETWAPDQVIRASRNPYYWDAANVKSDVIAFYPIDNQLTEETLFREGLLHMTSSMLPSKFDSYMAKHPEKVRVDPYLGVYYYRINVTKPPLDDARVRCALALSVDREDLVRNVVRMGRKPAYCFTPPDTAGYTSTAQLIYNVEEARRLLAEAGYPDGKGFPPLDILYNTSESHKQIAEALQSMWSEALHIEVRLLNQEWKVYLDSMQQLDYQLARSGWIADYVDPINFLDCFLTGGGNNRTGWSSPVFDALIAKAMTAPDRTERMAVLQEAERMLVDECPMIPIYFYTNTYLKAPELAGVEPNMLGYFVFKGMSLESTGGAAP